MLREEIVSIRINGETRLYPAEPLRKIIDIYNRNVESVIDKEPENETKNDIAAYPNF
jgi:hypothetical protein